MPNMTITNSQGSWVSYVENTTPPILFHFVGGSSQGELASVRDLANAMQQGQQTLEETIANVFTEMSPSIDGAEMASQLFGTADVLLLGEETVYTAAAGLTLLDEIADVGTALIAAL